MTSQEHMHNWRNSNTNCFIIWCYFWKPRLLIYCIPNYSDRNKGRWSVKTGDKMKNNSENYLKFPKKPGENSRKNQEKMSLNQVF